MDCFLLLYPTNNPKNQNFEKMKKLPGDIITLHRCTINDNHIMYGSWDMEDERHNFIYFLSFWTIFCSFTHTPNNPKNQNFEKMKETPGDIIILHKCNINDNHIMYGSWDMEHTDIIFCQFGPFLALLLYPTPWRYYHFTDIYHKWQSHDIWSLRYEVWQTELFAILDCFSP